MKYTKSYGCPVLFLQDILLFDLMCLHTVSWKVPFSSFIFYIKKKYVSVKVKAMKSINYAKFHHEFLFKYSGFVSTHRVYKYWLYDLKIHWSLIKQTRVSPRFSTDFSVFDTVAKKPFSFLYISHKTSRHAVSKLKQC